MPVGHPLVSVLILLTYEPVRQEEAEVRWRSVGLTRREEAEPAIRVIGWPRMGRGQKQDG